MTPEFTCGWSQSAMRTASSSGFDPLKHPEARLLSIELMPLKPAVVMQMWTPETVDFLAVTSRSLTPSTTTTVSVKNQQPWLSAAAAEMRVLLQFDKLFRPP